VILRKIIACALRRPPSAQPIPVAAKRSHRVRRDSITAQGVGNPNGYFHRSPRPERGASGVRHEAVGLGFSGHTVNSWPTA
jgi:hypothetical protein